jgi:hypothetical protein
MRSSFSLLFPAVLGLFYPTVAASEDCTSWREMYQQLNNVASNWSARWQGTDDAEPIHIHKTGAVVTVEDRVGQRTMAWKDAVAGFHLLALEFYFPADLVKCPPQRRATTQIKGDITINIKNTSSGAFQSILTMNGQSVGSATLTLRSDLQGR